MLKKIAASSAQSTCHSSWCFQAAVQDSAPRCHVEAVVNAFGNQPSSISAFFCLCKPWRVRACYYTYFTMVSSEKGIPSAKHQQQTFGRPHAIHYDLEPLLNATQCVAFMHIAEEPMKSSLMGWGKVARRGREVGLTIPEATAIVESGFYAHKVLMFEHQQRTITLQHWVLLAQLVAMFLNFSLLQRMTSTLKTDSRLVSIMSAAFERLEIAAGFSAHSATHAEQLFRQKVLQLQLQPRQVRAPQDEWQHFETSRCDP